MKKLALALLLGASLYATELHTAKVLQSMNSGGYTYMKVDDGTNSYWIAMTQRNVKKGDTIKYTEQGWMKNFHSKTLNRTFDNILFAGDATAAQTHQAVTYPPDIINSKYKTNKTITIAEAFKNRNQYAGKTVSIRAKVTKVSHDIMKLNWVHLEDGSRFMGMDDLVFTTDKTTPKEGDVVTATGTLVKDKDFGYGYFYPVIIQNTSFKK
ncbi:MAG: SH3-like domain-containing protein [Epsilonproteobacteria bacterium]|nr:SH3-like domain-containing protein [Campylobacterota bacterium]